MSIALDSPRPPAAAGHYLPAGGEDTSEIAGSAGQKVKAWRGESHVFTVAAEVNTIDTVSQSQASGESGCCLFSL